MDKCSMDGDRRSSRVYVVDMYIVEKGWIVECLNVEE